MSKNYGIPDLINIMKHVQVVMKLKVQIRKFFVFVFVFGGDKFISQHRITVRYILFRINRL